VILADLEQLAELMTIDYDFWVTEEATYELKRADIDCLSE